MKRLMLLAWIGLATLPTALFGFQPPSQPAPKIIEVLKIKDNFYVLTGGGGNTSVFVTHDHGVVVVDTKNPGWGSLLVEKIKSITDKPIKTVILTHAHSDHVGGLAEFPKGIQIVAQENAKANMLKASLYGPGDLFKKPENAKFLPNKTFNKKLTLFSGADEIDLYYFGPGETGDDAWVVFPSLRILVAGDNFSRKEVNLIDDTAGGTGALARTLRSAVNTIKGVDTVVPGHQHTVFTWADLKEYADYSQEFLDWVLVQKKAGKSADEVAAEYKYPAKYANYGPPRLEFLKLTTRAIYNTPGLD
jgi:cyclase